MSEHDGCYGLAGWSEREFSFGAVGTYEVQAHAENEDGEDWDWAVVYVATMGFSPSPPFPYIAVNDDDDDENGRMDNYNSDPDGPLENGVSYDDDLVPVLITCNSPRGDPDLIELSIVHVPYILQVWEQRNRSGLLIGNGDFGQDWTPGALWSKTVYVEGMYASTGQGQTYDPWLWWFYFGYLGPWTERPSLSGWNGTDASKKRWIVVHVDMDMPTVQDDYDENNNRTTEETTPGGFIPLGDFAELTVRPVMPRSVVVVPPVSNWDQLTVSVNYTGTGQIQLWDAAKTQELSLPYTFSPTANSNFCIKGVHESLDPCDVKLILTHTETNFKDIINLTIVKIEVAEVGFTGDHMITYGNSGWVIDNPDGWWSVWQGGSYSDPVCYTKNTPPTMFARFQVFPPVPGEGITGVSVRAKVDSTIIGSRTGCTIIGTAVEDPLSTDNYVDGVGGGSPVPDSDVICTLIPTFTWEMSSDGTHWFPVGTSGPHTMYWTYSTPQAPQAIPWTGVLDIACWVASGKSQAPGAVDDLWSEFYNMSGGIYDSDEGGQRYASSGSGGLFNLTNWLSKYGHVEIVNCYDMAQSLVIFSNALGCGTVNSFVAQFGGYLNCVRPIGRDWANNPFYLNPVWNHNPIVDGSWTEAEGRSTFLNHAFCSLNGCIWDASVGAADSSAPADAPPCEAYWLAGGDSWDNMYTTWVIDSSPTPSPGSPTDCGFSVY